MRDVHKLSEFVLQNIVFDKFCFSGEEFPACEFADPARVEDLIGPYRISVEYFDSGMTRVSRAAKPGRYAAVVHIKHAGGTSRRFITLYRFAEGFCILAWLENPEGKKGWEPLDIRQLPVRINMPAIAGLKLDRARVGHHRDELDAYLTSGFLVRLEHDRRGASLLAALDGAQHEDVPARILERRWWVTFKRKYYGLGERYGELVVGPRKITGRPARELSGGRPEDAGLKPGFIDHGVHDGQGPAGPVP